MIGDIEVARRTCSELVAHGFAVTHLLHPTDSEMRVALTQAVSAVAVLVRGDVIALRYALLVEHLLPEVRLVVTLFDRTVAEQLGRVVPNCQVTSPANVAVPSIIGACVGPDVLAVSSQAAEPTMV
ncbi:MAG: portal protein, partial [Mycobacteriaceae bacterium]